MTGIIHEHNALNGYRFSLLEYGLVSVGLGLLVAYYLAAGRLLDAVAWFGIVVNCAVIALFALTAIRRGAFDPGSRPLRRKDFRDRAAREHPGLGRRTGVLVVASVLPYVLAAAALLETIRLFSMRPTGRTDWPS